MNDTHTIVAAEVRRALAAREAGKARPSTDRTCRPDRGGTGKADWPQSGHAQIGGNLMKLRVRLRVVTVLIRGRHNPSMPSGTNFKGCPNLRGARPVPRKLPHALVYC